jgi:hypothetical protein
MRRRDARQTANKPDPWSLTEKAANEVGSAAKLVMPGHSRPKDGVASARLCPDIHVLAAVKQDAGTSPAMTASDRPVATSSQRRGEFSRARCIGGQTQ